MLTLGIETSAGDGSVALVDSGGVLGESDLSRTGRLGTTGPGRHGVDSISPWTNSPRQTGRPRRRHARSLVADLKALLERCRKTPRDVEVVAVSIGPGSFTGLRVGVVCAKTFAYAVGCRVVAVDTMESIASQAPPGVAEVNVLIDAHRGEMFVGRCLRSGEGDRWRRVGEIRLAPSGSLAAIAAGDVPFTGPGLFALAAEAPVARGLPDRFWAPRATSVARIGETMARAGHSDNLWTLEPVYIRRSAAEEKAEAAGISMTSDAPTTGKT
jgi:tRNA threonylcarbamoyladenosine biosynthesis protein TsaB